jgi:hypothetical protein
MSETVEFVLTAKDRASSVFRATAAEVKMLDHQVQATSKNMKGAAGAVTSLAKAFGGSWLGDAAGGFGKLGDAIGKTSSAMSGAAGGSLAMKAGLVGLAAYGGFTVGKMLGDFIFQTKHWEGEFSKAMDTARSQMEQLDKIREKQIRRDQKEITTSEASADQKISSLDEFNKKLGEELSQQKARLRTQKDLATAQENEWGQALRGTKQRKEQTAVDIAGTTARIKLLEQMIDGNDKLKEQIDDQRKAQEKADRGRAMGMEEDLEFRIKTFDMTKQEIDLLKIQQDSRLTDEEKARQTELTKTLQGLEKERETKERNLEITKKLRKEEEKRAESALKAAEKELEEAERKLKAAESLSVSPERTTLQATDARLLTQQISGPSEAEKARAVAEKQRAIAEAQREIMEKQKDVADRTYILLQARLPAADGDGFTL